ncbi:hypothetical protein [Catenulispora pinisilvae]|uniref:hypothetical protein n=1 Tax=Catenulispora pinisilvae TaxID=2705253 RepID=UPI001890C3E8|nr:hypothetical protein [Catenulispora pinisilvae]
MPNGLSPTDLRFAYNLPATGGMDCGGDYQCDAVAGYDGPTGLGTPNGLAAF